MALDEPDAAALALSLRAGAKVRAHTDSVFQPMRLEAELERARGVLRRHPGATELREVVDALTD